MDPNTFRGVTLCPSRWLIHYNYFNGQFAKKTELDIGLNPILHSVTNRTETVSLSTVAELLCGLWRWNSSYPKSWPGAAAPLWTPWPCSAVWVRGLNKWHTGKKKRSKFQAAVALFTVSRGNMTLFIHLQFPCPWMSLPSFNTSCPS